MVRIFFSHLKIREILLNHVSLLTVFFLPQHIFLCQVMLIFGFYSSLISLGDFTFFSACLLLFCICMNFASILDGQLHFLFDCTIHKFFFYGLVINFFSISLLSNLTRKWKKSVVIFFKKNFLLVKILEFYGKNYNSLK